MKFVSDKKTLLSLIIPAASAASNKSTLPALEGILFKLEGETLTVCGYDLEIGITTDIEATIQQQGEIVVGAKLFSEIVSAPFLCNCAEKCTGR